MSRTQTLMSCLAGHQLIHESGVIVAMLSMSDPIELYFSLFYSSQRNRTLLLSLNNLALFTSYDLPFYTLVTGRIPHVRISLCPMLSTRRYIPRHDLSVIHDQLRSTTKKPGANGQRAPDTNTRKFSLCSLPPNTGTHKMRTPTTTCCSGIITAIALSNNAMSSMALSTHRIEQTTCAPPAGGCSGPGLWDENKCQCLCIEKYCYDSSAGTCSTVKIQIQRSFPLYDCVPRSNTN